MSNKQIKGALVSDVKRLKDPATRIIVWLLILAVLALTSALIVRDNDNDNAKNDRIRYLQTELRDVKREIKRKDSIMFVRYEKAELSIYNLSRENAMMREILGNRIKELEKMKSKANNLINKYNEKR